MKTRRLYTRIYLHALGVLLVVGLATTGVFSLGQRGAFLSEVTERLARHLAGELGDRLTDAQARAVALDRMHQDFEVDLAVRDLKGQVVASAGVALPELKLSELAALRQGRNISQQWTVASAAPIRNPKTGEFIGILQMSPPRRFHYVGQPRLGRPLMAVTLVLLLVALASLPLARRISRPVELLTQASRRLGAGDLSYRIPIPEWSPRPMAVPCQYQPQSPQHHHHSHHEYRFHRHPHRHSPMDELHELMHAWNDMADRIERLLRGQRELLANISHELRSPLTRVRVALELLPRDGETESRLREVEDDLGELEQLIEDVLMTSRLEATGLPTHPARVAVRPLLEQVAERARNHPLTATKTVIVTEGPELVLRADAGLVKRALFNLVENAAKYGAPPIVLSAAQYQEAIEIVVSDEGGGIPAAERERVFEPFYRRDKAHTPHSKGSAARGFGLGLTLARRVAEAHQGTISIAPLYVAEGTERGCRVTLRLPLGTEDA